MVLKKYVILLSSIVSLSACTEVDPTFDKIGADLSQPKFSGSTTKNFPIAAYNSPVTVTGECDLRTMTVEWSIDGGTTWQDSGSPVRDCADKNFSFTAPDASVFGFTASSTAGQQQSVLLRAKTVQDLVSDSSTMNVRIQNPESSRLAHTSSGGGLMAGSTFKIFGQVGAPIESKTMTGSYYKIRLREEN